MTKEQGRVTTFTLPSVLGLCQGVRATRVLDDQITDDSGTKQQHNVGCLDGVAAVLDFTNMPYQKALQPRE